MSDIARLEEALIRAYAIIGRATPMKSDCGILCGAACCKDARPDDNVEPDTDARSESNAGPDALGMYLFPGEAGLLSREPGFRLFQIPFMGERIWFLVCEGICDRRKRPLACRIFPLAPHINGAGVVSALPDPRAARMCPLAGGEHVDPAFRRVVTKAFRHLAGEPEILEYMRLLAADLDDMRRFIDNKKR